MAVRTQNKIDDQVVPLVRRIITVTVYIVAVLFVLSVWGIQIAPLLAGAGIAGIAIAFALQESLKNIFGGVSLAFDNAYSSGDRIKLADGTAGTVYEVSLRSTKIRTFTGDLLVVPNSKIANDIFTAYAQPTQDTVVTVPFSVAYGVDVEKVKDFIRPLLKSTPHFFEDDDHKASVDFVEMGPYSLNMRVWFWVDDYTKSWDAKIDITKKIYDVLTKNKIDIPFPTQTLHIHQEKDK